MCRFQTFPTKIKKVTEVDQIRAGPTARANRRHIRVFVLPPMAVMHAEAKAEAAAAATGAPKRRAAIKANAGPHDAALKALRNEFKAYYIQPSLDQIPYNKNMARNFSSTEDQSEEQRIKRKGQANASRVSRDRMKFVDEHVRMERERLERELIQLMIELQQSEQQVNALCKKKKKMPIKWSTKWD